MKPMHEILSNARSRIMDRQDWCQFSRGGHDKPRCALGAVDLATNIDDTLDGYDTNHDAVVALAAAARSLGWDNDHVCGNPANHRAGDAWLVANFNNMKTHSDVLALFDEAIRAERAKSRTTDISIFTDMLDVHPMETALTSNTRSNQACLSGCHTHPLGLDD